MNKSDVKITTEIGGSASDVWKIISDYDNWNRWHKSDVKLITRDGIPKYLQFQHSGIPLVIKLRNVKIVENEFLEWEGALPKTRLLLKGIRRISLLPLGDNRCFLIQEESFYGVASKFLKSELVREYSRNYEILNQNIKSLVE